MKTRDGRWEGGQGLWFHSGPDRVLVLPAYAFHTTHKNNFRRGLIRLSKRYGKEVPMTQALPEAAQDTLRRGLAKARAKEVTTKAVMEQYSLRANAETIDRLTEWGARRGYQTSTVMRFALEIFADLVTRFPAEE